MTEFVTIDASTLETRRAYNLVCGAVAPRPVAWITTVDEEGRVNAAPFSSYNYVAHSPPMVGVNIGIRGKDLKDTAHNLRMTGEFVVNVATEDNLEAMHSCSAEYARGVSELEKAGVPTIPSKFIKPPRVAISPVQMECRIVHIIPLGRGLNTFYIGEILAFHFRSDVYDGKYVDTAKVRPVSRLGGPWYAALGKLFNMPGLQAPPGADAS